MKGFRVEINDPGVFVYVHDDEVIYWDTTDLSHKQQGLEIAAALKILYEEGIVAFLHHIKAHPWHHDHVQFARLLSEVRAAGLTDEQYKALSTSMDLPREQRAECAWEEIKETP